MNKFSREEKKNHECTLCKGLKKVQFVMNSYTEKRKDISGVDWIADLDMLDLKFILMSKSNTQKISIILVHHGETHFQCYLYHSVKNESYCSE